MNTNKEIIKKPELYALSSPIFDPKISKRCGKGGCYFYNKHDPVSGCNTFKDRRKCSKSMQQRKKSANTSRKNPSINWFGC